MDVNVLQCPGRTYYSETTAYLRVDSAIYGTGHMVFCIHTWKERETSINTCSAMGFSFMIFYWFFIYFIVTIPIYISIRLYLNFII